MKHCSKALKKEKGEKEYEMPKSKALAEHKRLVPELKKVGLKKEAKEQEKDLKAIKKI